MALIIEEAPAFHGQIPGDLHHPGFVGMGGNASDVAPTGRDLHEEEHVEGGQSGFGEDLGGEEIAGGDHVLVGFDEVGPGSRRASARRWWEAVPAEDVGDGLIADGVAEVAEGPGDAIP